MSETSIHKHTAVGVINNWVEWNNAGDFRKVASLYSEEAVLQPTFSPHVLSTEEGRLKYFESLASRKGIQVSLHEKTLKIRPLSDSIQVASGIYRFSFEIDDEPLTFEARFTWVLDLSCDRPVKHHHSSQVPRTLS
jgi:hypothetical protein